MAVFRVERNKGYTVMSNHHLRNKELTLKAKGLLSQMLSLPEDWDYTLAGLSQINRESIDAIRTAVWELEKAGYIKRRQGRDEKGKMTAIEYTIYEQPQPPDDTPPGLDNPTLENPTPGNPILENPTPGKPTTENPMQLNKDIQRTDLPTKEKINTDLQSTHSIPIHSPNPSPLEQEAATSLIEQDKCVLISQHADSLGAPTACELKGVPNVSYNGSTYEAGKNTFIVSSAINWAPYFQLIIENTVKGEEIPTNWVGTIATNSVVLSGVNQDVVDGESTVAELNKVIDQLNAGTLHVFDVNNFTVTVDAKNKLNANAKVDENKHLTEYMADIDGDYVGDTNVVHDGYFDESGDSFRSAPYFDIIIDGITNINTNYGG